MDVAFFLRERLEFIRQLYLNTSETFIVRKAKIDIGEEPFIPPYSEDGEPPFLAEWQEAEDSLQVLGYTCLSLLPKLLRQITSMIRQHCWDFLRAMKLAVAELQDLPQDHWSDWGRSFTHGTCGDSSELLAIYLHEARGFDRERIEITMDGRLQCGQSHACLFVDGFYVDITASQFQGLPDLIFRRHSHWHERFKGYYRRPYNAAIDSLQHVGDLRHRRMLNHLMKHL